jgi:hypothetical protein
MSRVRSGYPALQFIALVLKVFSCLHGIGAFGCFVLMLLSLRESTSDDGSGLATAVGRLGAFLFIVWVVALVIWAILLWASAEMILLMIDIENNTRRTAAAATSQPSPLPAPAPQTANWIGEPDDIPDFSSIAAADKPADDGPRTVECPHCQARIKVPAGTPAGKTTKCPKCGEAMSV